MDICVTDTNAKAYKGLSSRTVLEAAAWVKKATYLKACLDQQHTFAPFVIEARTFEKRIASLLAAKWGRKYSKLFGFVRAKRAMAVVRPNTFLLCGTRLKRPKWIPFVNATAL